MSEPLTLQWIQEQVRQGHFLYTLHADEERRNDGLSPDDVRAALLTGRVIEEYPEDPRGSSCLVHGRVGGRDVHIVCGRNRSGWLVLITVYLPGPPKWRTPTERNRT